jgi:hypothetical protein
MHKVADVLLTCASVIFASLEWIYQLDKPLGLASKLIGCIAGLIAIYRFYKEKTKTKKKQP